MGGALCRRALAEPQTEAWVAHEEVNRQQDTDVQQASAMQVSSQHPKSYLAPVVSRAHLHCGSIQQLVGRHPPAQRMLHCLLKVGQLALRPEGEGMQGWRQGGHRGIMGQEGAQ